MATSHEITCINKTDRQNIHERIKSIGGFNNPNERWKLSLEKAIDGIENNTWAFYVYQNNKRVNVIVATSASGYKYLKTEADTTTNNNLLNLPECP